MSLNSILSIAGSGLQGVQRELAIVSQNVANAGTAGYVREDAPVDALTAGGQGFGVRVGPATRQVDAALQAATRQQTGDLAAQQTTLTALTALDTTQGTTGGGNDLAGHLGKLSSAYTTLNAQPDSAGQQAAVIYAAARLANGINALATAVQAGRQTAQAGLQADVATLNTALGTIGTLSQQIVAGRAAGRSTADLESQRDAQEGTAAQLAGLRFIGQPSGDVLALAGAALVDLRAATGPFSVTAATLGPGSAAPPLMLSGAAVTAQVTTGTIGANLKLRDMTLPLAQAGVDLLAKTVANRFDDQGLRLFTTPTGAPPSSTGSNVAATDVGFANIMQVNPAVIANPAAVRDGTAVSSGGQAPNPAGGPAGYTGLIDRVTAATFGVQPAPPVTGLGAAGTLTLPYAASATLAGFAANLLSAQSQAITAASAQVDATQALSATLHAKLQDSEGVSVDAELSAMISLQNSYSANAKVVTTVQTMFSQLLNAVAA